MTKKKEAQAQKKEEKQEDKILKAIEGGLKVQEPPPRKPHISYSQINMFLRCPRQYEFRYVNGLKFPPGAALLLGKTWHAGIETNYKQKMETGKDLPIEQMKDIFSDNLNQSAEQEEYVFREGESLDSVKDVGIQITELHHKAIAPKVEPLLVEKEFRLPLKNRNKDLLGYIDLVDGKNGIFIVDNKSKSKTPSQREFDGDLQFSIYSLAHRMITGELESGLRMDCVVKTKTPKAVQLYTTRETNELVWVLDLIETVDDAIQTGVFPPSNPVSNFLCSEKWCGYWDICKNKY